MFLKFSSLPVVMGMDFIRLVQITNPLLRHRLFVYIVGCILSLNPLTITSFCAN